MTQSDKLIFKLLQNKNEEVFQILYKDYFEELARFAMHYVGDRQKAEDLVQDFFCHFWDNIETLSITVTLKSYLYTSIKNRCLNYLRDLKVRDRYNLMYIESFWINIQEEDFDDNYIIKEVLKAIENLPPKLSSIFILKYLEKKKISEISQLKNLNENTIKKRLIKARRMLKEKLSHLISLLFF